MKQGYVYIMTDRPTGVLYIGVTSDLAKRIWEHKNGIFEGFSKKYGLDKLVYYEIHDDIENAIKREKQMKEWKRNWKFKLIIDSNPKWKDLYDDIT
ncbi:MAG: GIY-YIG nuclease family protein [Rickettsiales bacterium]|nr:GIY-YIG nuclease family protein [Rickettsiales bacterium]